MARLGPKICPYFRARGERSDFVGLPHLPLQAALTNVLDRIFRVGPEARDAAFANPRFVIRDAGE